MKRLFLFTAIILAFSISLGFATEKEGKKDEVLRKSQLGMPPDFGPDATSFPVPFNWLNQQNNPGGAAISTGYYYVDQNENLPPFWKPRHETANPFFQANLWRKIVPGPAIVPNEFWDSPENTDGYYFFRNPESMATSQQGVWTTSDSTDDAIAGPIPLGINGGFYFNGIRYDSFYVSTNGVIALTNRRYYYDKDGNRVIPEGSENAYDPMSMTWFAGDPTRELSRWHRRVQSTFDPVTQTFTPVIDPQTDSFITLDGMPDNDDTPDNFGYYVSVLGQDPYFDPQNPPGPTDGGEFDSLGGIRARPGFGQNGYNFPYDLRTIIPANRKSALIAFAWGDMHLSQYNTETKLAEDFGQAWFKRSITGDTLQVAVFNLVPKGAGAEGNIRDVPFGTLAAPEHNRAGVGNNFVYGNINVILARPDSSVTINFTTLSGTGGNDARGSDLFRANSICGVKGYARHTGFVSDNEGGPNGGVQEGNYYYPWWGQINPNTGQIIEEGEYIQATHYFAGYIYQVQDYPNSFSAVKFKQWQNSLRVASIQYLVRDPDADIDEPDAYDFVIPVEPGEAADYELLAGEPLLGAIQPRAVIQNLTNEIQGPFGVNFVPQDFTFNARFKVQNQITCRTIYNRIVPITDRCMKLNGDSVEIENVRTPNWFQCTGDPNVRVRLVRSLDAQKSQPSSVVAASLYSGDEYDAEGFNGVPPYHYVQINFPPFEPNPFIPNHIGRHFAQLIADPSDPVNGQYQGDEWPFDDSSSVNLYVMRRIDARDVPEAEGFQDDVSEYHVICRGSDIGTRIPSVLKWVSIFAEVAASGGPQLTGVSMAPLAPRRAYKPHNPAPEEGETEFYENRGELIAPAIVMDRYNYQGQNNNAATELSLNYGGTVGSRSAGKFGDIIRSYPIDLRGQNGASISFAVQRNTLFNKGNVFRGFSDQLLIGPEPRVTRNRDLLERTTQLASGSGWADRFVLEFIHPSDDQVNRITNVPDADWRHHPGRRGTEMEPVTNMAAFTLYGAGGFHRGFLAEDPDSVITHYREVDPLERLDAKSEYGFNEFDDGIDYEFSKYFVAIPDTFINWRNQGAKNFRFRFRVLAADQSNPLIGVFDDADAFVLDNIQIITNPEAPDLEVLNVKTNLPYQIIPASQATNIPISVKVSNNANIDASTFVVKVNIYRLIDEARGTTEDSPIYCRSETISNLTALRQLEIPMPSWNARKSQPQGVISANYRIEAIVSQREPDYEPVNDTNYTDVSITMASVFAYDDDAAQYFEPTGVDANGTISGRIYFEGESVTNDVSADNGLPGSGLNLWAFNTGGSNADPSDPPVSANTRTGFRTGYAAGEIAMKFELQNPDTLRGYQAFFGSLNASPEWIRFRLLEDNNNIPSNDLVVGQNINGEPISSVILAQRMRFYLNGEIQWDLFPNMYVTYELDEPLPLPRGSYWVAIAQLNETGLELGATGNRMGMRITNFYQSPNPPFVWGPQGNALNINKQFREVNASGNLVSSNYFAYSNGLSADQAWVEFSPSQGNPAYGHLDHRGNVGLLTWTTASYIPLLRPWFGPKTHGSAADEYEWCPDDIPVEMLNFAGEVRSGGNALYWETASEENNYGFDIERKLDTEDENAWTKIKFVQGQGNSTKLVRYNYLDNEVVPNETYQYRLKQIDLDGTVSCNTSQIVTLTYTQVGDVELYANVPNPVRETTELSFKLPQNEVVKLEIIDIYGNVVKTLVNDQMLSASIHNFQWDGTDNTGTKVSSGSYIYRLKAGDEILTSKMTVIN